jgi:hypothetical protein
VLVPLVLISAFLMIVIPIYNLINDLQQKAARAESIQTKRQILQQAATNVACFFFTFLCLPYFILSPLSTSASLPFIQGIWWQLH